MTRATSSSFQSHSPIFRRRSGGQSLSYQATLHSAAADIIVVAMTSNPAVVPFSFRIQTADLVEGQLNHPGTVRVDKIYTLATSIVVKKFGKVSPAVLDRIRKLLMEVTAAKL